MRVTFIGVGAAFDEHQPNTSILIESAEQSLLADCGFTAASAFWRHAEKPLSLDAIYLTHFHGDHYFGVPHLLLRMYEEGRTTPLTILGQPGVEERITALMEMAYRNLLTKLQFELHFMECQPGVKVGLGDMQLMFAWNDHPMDCLSLRVQAGGKSIFYSGDGRPTDETRNLACGCDLVVHESYSLEPDTPGHGTLNSSIVFARESSSKAVALVHIDRNVRRDHLEDIMDRATKTEDVKVLLPEPGDCWEPPAL